MWLYVVLTIINATCAVACIWQTSKATFARTLAEVHAEAAKGANDMVTITARTLRAGKWEES